MKNIPLLIGSIFFLILLFFASVGHFLPFINSGLEEEILRREGGKYSMPAFPPSKEDILGTDRFGRDMFSLLVIGTKETLFIVFLAGFIRYLIAIPLGAGAVFSKIILSVLNSWNYLLSFIPPIFLVVLIIGLPAIYFSFDLFIWFILVIAVVEVGRVAEMIRSQIVHQSSNTYIEAAITSGTTKLGLLRRHYFPHLRQQLIQSFVSDLARVLFLMAQLAVVQIFIGRKFVSQMGGAYEAQNTSLAYPSYLQTIIRDMWTQTWIPYATVLFISFMIITFYLLSEGVKIWYKRKYRFMV
jgi:peptide/nickel transport system permease protein